MYLELIQFPYSTFNEKVRWALDYKGINRRNKYLLPGPHASFVKKRTGQTATPVLRRGSEHIAGSARIIEALEEMQPAAPLFPEKSEDRDKALEIQRRFDEDWGPRSRRAILVALGAAPGYIARMFASQHSSVARSIYGAMLPLMRKKVREGNGIRSQADIDDGEQAIDDMLDYVAETSSATGYLAGDRFSVADLTAASFIAPIADPPDSPMTRPTPIPAQVQAWCAPRRDHPGVAWVLTMYAKHRKPGSNAAPL